MLYAGYYYSAVTLGNAFAVVTDLKTKVLCSREGILTYFFSVGWFILLARKIHSPFIKGHTGLVKSVGKLLRSIFSCGLRLLLSSSAAFLKLVLFIASLV